MVKKKNRTDTNKESVLKTIIAIIVPILIIPLIKKVLLPISGVFVFILIFIALLFFLEKKYRRYLIIALVVLFIIFILLLFDQIPVSYFIIDFSEDMNEYLTKENIKRIELQIISEYPQHRIGLAVFGGKFSFNNNECDDFKELISPRDKNQNIISITNTIDNLISQEPNGKNLIQSSIINALNNINVILGNHKIIVITASPVNMCEPLDRREIDIRNKKLIANFSIIINSLGNLSKQELDMYDSFADFHTNISSEEEIKELDEYLVTGYCGDGICDGDETCYTCSGDCGTCPEIDDCKKDNEQYKLPCFFSPEKVEFNNFSSISKEIIGDYELTESIAELYRNEEGLIMTVTTYKKMIIPGPEEPKIKEYYDYYFNEVMNINILECPTERTRFPCFLEIDKEKTYEDIAEEYYSTTNDFLIQRIKLANDTEFFFNERGLPDLQPISKLTKGTIVILPTMP